MRTLQLSLALALSSVLPAFFMQAGLAEEAQASDPEAISLTIYNQNFGLVKDVRNLKLNEGVNYLRFEDVAAQIDPTSVSFRSLTAPNAVVVREQNYQYDLMDPNTILSKSVGKELRLKQYLSSGAVSEITGKLLNSPVAVTPNGSGYSSTNYLGLVLKTPEGIVLNPQGQIQLAALPAGLVSKPSLLWKLESTKAGEHKAEIAYQTAGISWHCDYVAVVNQDDSQTDLCNWVTIDNKSGATYKNAGLKLMAGDVHRVTPPRYGIAGGMAMNKAVRAFAAPAPQFVEQSFSEYHLYSLKGKTDVANNETKQMSLFNASNIPVKKLFVFESEAQTPYYNRSANTGKVQVKFEILNSEKNKLGMPMPKGKVRVYKKDSDGSLQFIGEDEIDHTPKDEKIRLYIGDAFDLVAERKQTSSQAYGNANGTTRYRNAYEISLRNHKKENVSIVCIEHAAGDWNILNSSQPYTKKDSHSFEFQVTVPANGESKVNYEIESHY